jgi:hypothetical protein
MTFMNEHGSKAENSGNIFLAATQNVRCSGDIANAATQVIAKRVVLGMAASMNPLEADCAEFSRMVPEKVEAFSTAGMVILEQTGQSNRQMMHSASEEIATATLAAIEMTGCSSPAAVMEAQSRYVHAWFARATSIWSAMGLQAFEAQAAAMEPVRQTVVANAERLGR